MGRHRAGTWVLAALAPVAFLAVDPVGWYPFGPAKWLAVSALVPLGSGLCWLQGTLRIDRVLAVALGALLAALALAAAFGADPWYAWVGTPERNFGLLTWVLAALSLLAGSSLRGAPTAVAARPENTSADAPAEVLAGEWRLVFAGAVVAGLGIGLVAVAEALGWQAGPIGQGSTRLTGSFGSAAYLGAAAVLLLPVALGVLLDRRCGRGLRVVAALASVSLGVAVVGAGARAAWVGLAAAGSLVLWMRRAWLVAHGRVALVAGAIGLVGLGVVAVATPAGERVHAAFDPDAPGGQGRLDEWRVAAKVVARHPVLGVGPEGYRTAFAEGADVAYEQAHGRDPLPDRAHSGLIDVAQSGGFGAALAWLAVMGLIGRSALRAIGSGPPWLVGLAAGLVAHGVGQLLLFPTFELEPMAWLLAGVVLASTARPGEAVERTVPSWAAAGLVLLAMVAAVAGGAGLLADRRADEAAEALGGPNPALALERADDAVALRPDGVRYRLLQSRARVAAGEGTLAGLDAVDAALEISPRDPVVQRERARLLVARARATQVPAQVAEARAYLDGLVEDDPVNASLRILQGEAAVLADDADGAEAAWAEAERLAPKDPTPPANLARLYLATDRRSEARRAATRALALDAQHPAAQQVLDRLAEG